MKLGAIFFCLVLVFQAIAIPVIPNGAQFLSALLDAEISAAETSFGALSGAPLGLNNAGFEQASGGWSGGLSTSAGKSTPSIKCKSDEDTRLDFCDTGPKVCRHSQRDAPVEGSEYAELPASSTLSQSVGTTRIEVGKTYRVRAWARGVNPSWGGMSSKIVWKTAATKAKVSLTADGQDIASAEKDVGAPKMQGLARADPTCAKCHQDDGGNVFIEGGYRMHAANSMMYQPEASDPITDPWYDAGKAVEGAMALAPVNIPGLKALYATWYAEDSPKWSKITMHKLSGTPPKNYKVDGIQFRNDEYEPTTSSVVLQNPRDNEQPWVMDAQIYYDTDTARLWMIWGGHETWISELDPTNGKVCCSPNCKGGSGNCASTDFNTHSTGQNGVHTKIISWDDLSIPGNTFEGDGCSQRYMEGPALYKYGGHWFAFSSWGGMSDDYTIRVCRASDPRGPYVDKSGKNCAKLVDGMYGSTMVLGPEGEQSVPGHAHIWQENGQHYMGYDFRQGAARSGSREGVDYMAIRKLHWIKGAEGWWPTIWQPIDVEFTGTAALAGKQLGVRLANVGEPGNHGAFDGVEVTVEGGSDVMHTGAPAAPDTAAPTHGPTGAPVASSTNAPVNEAAPPASSQCHITMAGRSTKLSMHPVTCSPNSERHYVRCCAKTGTAKVQMSEYGCNAGKTYSEANNICTAAGLRLCTQDEITADRTAGTGCGYDAQRIWTSTTAMAGTPTDPPSAAATGAPTGTPVTPATGEPTNAPSPAPTRPQTSLPTHSPVAPTTSSPTGTPVAPASPTVSYITWPDKCSSKGYRDMTAAECKAHATGPRIEYWGTARSFDESGCVQWDQYSGSDMDRATQEWEFMQSFATIDTSFACPKQAVRCACMSK